jgi:hypothetical protein
MEPTQDFWEVFDNLERQRRSQRVRHEQAFRQLDVATSTAESNESLLAWDGYCEAARSLDSCMAEIERIVWKLNR